MHNRLQKKEVKKKLKTIFCRLIKGKSKVLNSIYLFLKNDENELP